ncbi:MAG: Asp-tRNA(Asn)/Glu-tRNA(Gln) amidotransferase subunit GatC [Myxococcus sp.]|nr:Asp-tRNA(Asn)/Glu-tRNA(Gln) amidotransferase subunit GatC [Myxococcus sp.]
MKLTEQQVRHVARLARLALSPEELVTYREQLSAVLDAVDALAQVDTTGVVPTSVVGASTPHLRADVPHGEVGVKVALANAPQVDGTSFAIPRVIE